MERKTRVRFAPSPTGPLHMGGVRTALYNYLYAKQRGGDFIIRIEDTDSNRFVPGAEQYIIEALDWCGIIPDEGVENGKVVETPSERHPHAPYRQSQRRGIYRKYAEQLVENGYAYYAFDSAEELSAARAACEAEGKTFIYNQFSRMKLRNSLSLPESEWRPMLESRNDWTIRFRMPENTIVKMDDMIRGEEWLPSLPLHYLLYKAFGWEDTMPRFAHLSLLLKPVGNGKLSKRDGDKMGFPVFPLQWVNSEGEVSHGYREDGYFPDAFVNMLAMLGWNPGDDREIFSMDELIQAFSMDHVQKAGAKFNPDKAKWYNKEYLRSKSDSELADAFIPVLASKGIAVPDRDWLLKVVALIKERATFVADFWTIASYLFKAPEEYAEKDVAKFWKEENYSLAFKVADFILAFDGEFSKEGLEGPLEDYIRGNEWPMGKVMNCLRLMLAGSASGLGIADVVTLIGKEEVARRVAAAKAALC